MTDNATPLPAPTIANLVPPSADYPYFANGQNHPFDPHATEFSMANAGWLADAALLAYGTPGCIEAKIQSAAQLTAPMEVTCFSGPRTQCFVLHNDQFAVASFRGTRVEEFPDPISLLAPKVPGLDDGDAIPPGQVVFINWRDTVTDADLALDPTTGVHRGFAKALVEVWTDQVNPHLDQLKADNQDLAIWFTGHSLGAALATLAADAYSREKQVKGLYTFGSPRVGNNAFADQFRVSSFRFVHHDDTVTRLPPPGFPTFYTQLRGVEKYITAEGSIVDDPTPEGQISDAFTATVARLERNLRALKPLTLLDHLRSLGPDLSDLDLLKLNPTEVLEKVLRIEFVNNIRTLNVEIPVQALSDHAPLYYALPVWQNVSV
jgi:hypothetical protein